MMTEGDALKRWCPFARLSEMGGTYNRAGPEANLQCIGSACMAWRCDQVEVTHKRSLVDKFPSETHGYCGLAGKP